MSQTRAAISGGVGYGNPKLPSKPHVMSNQVLVKIEIYAYIRSCQVRKVILEVKQR